ncbi:DUF6214 family protein [Streptomyces nigra]|uniref:DUF6214 family protein n=1 Tax=Streptomyces nigra TaxID=1827580 RepID=UPI00364115DB
MSVWPAWEVRDGAGGTSWLGVRLEFGDGAHVDAVAVVGEGGVYLEDVRAVPALSLDDLAALADWIEDPLSQACGVAGRDADGSGASRARPEWPLGVEGQWLVAREYRQAQERGADPVLAVMGATGHSRRRSLRLIGQARDAGFLPPRRARR